MSCFIELSTVQSTVQYWKIGIR